MKKLFWLVLIAVCFSSFSICFAKNMYQVQIDNAEENFKQGNFSKTIEIYESLIQIEKARNPYIYYNLSNAYYRNGNIGKAILNIEKASILAPRDKDIKSNMKYLCDIAGHTKQAKILSILLRQFSLNEITVVSSAILISFIIFLSLFMIKRNLILKKAMVVSSILLIVFITFLSLKAYGQFLVKEAVVLSSVSARSGPNEITLEIFTVPEGRIVSVTAKTGNWINIEVKSENETLTGWVESGKIGSIN
jgi:tetratricopeptide (TPR) repeat protein